MMADGSSGISDPSAASTTQARTSPKRQLGRAFGLTAGLLLSVAILLPVDITVRCRRGELPRLALRVSHNNWADAVAFCPFEHRGRCSELAVAIDCDAYVSPRRNSCRGGNSAHQPHIRPDQRPNHYPEYGQAEFQEDGPILENGAYCPWPASAAAPSDRSGESRAYCVSIVIECLVD
jgi:hypothetical protein